ncbi:MAG TPA: hypothetical protein ENH82_09945 [bacterium]|nr:hypothetical protein [bacterium]
MKARRIRLKELQKQIEDRLAGDEKELEHTKNFLLKIVGEIGDMSKIIIDIRERLDVIEARSRPHSRGPK